MKYYTQESSASACKHTAIRDVPWTPPATGTDRPETSRPFFTLSNTDLTRLTGSSMANRLLSTLLIISLLSQAADAIAGDLDNACNNGACTSGDHICDATAAQCKIKAGVTCPASSTSCVTQASCAGSGTLTCTCSNTYTASSGICIANGALNAACLSGNTCTDPNHVCDTTLTPPLCKIKATATCPSGSTNCVASATCSGSPLTCTCGNGFTASSGTCIANGALNNPCLTGNTCTDTTNHVCDTSLATPLCKIKATKSCASSTSSCVSSATCTSNTCTCSAGFTADSTGKCMLDGGLNGVCLANSACTDATNNVCDAKLSTPVCKIKVAKTCTGNADKCVTGAACTGNTNTQCECGAGYTADTTTGKCNGASSLSKMTGFITVAVALFLGFHM